MLQPGSVLDWFYYKYGYNILKNSKCYYIKHLVSGKCLTKAWALISYEAIHE